ncbi:unnamed protein product, partial [Amoebophrya sp. A25]
QQAEPGDFTGGVGDLHTLHLEILEQTLMQCILEEHLWHHSETLQLDAAEQMLDDVDDPYFS